MSLASALERTFELFARRPVCRAGDGDVPQLRGERRVSAGLADVEHRAAPS